MGSNLRIALSLLQLIALILPALAILLQLATTLWRGENEDRWAHSFRFAVISTGLFVLSAFCLAIFVVAIVVDLTLFGHRQKLLVGSIILVVLGLLPFVLILWGMYKESTPELSPLS